MKTLGKFFDLLAKFFVLLLLMAVVATFGLIALGIVRRLILWGWS